MKQKCYFCDSELEGSQHTFRIGMKEELVCEECHVKTLNRRKAVEEESDSK